MHLLGEHFVGLLLLEIISEQTEHASLHIWTVNSHLFILTNVISWSILYVVLKPTFKFILPFSSSIITSISWSLFIKLYFNVFGYINNWSFKDKL